MVKSDREMFVDVICAGMYRACSTWQYTVAAHLIERYRAGERLGYLSGKDFANLTPSPSAEQRSGDASTTHWRVFKSHDGDRFFSRSFPKRRSLVLYSYRDVRDVTFSLMHKRGLTFDAILRQGMIHQILRNDHFWTRRPGVLVQRYDDLVQDPATGVLQIARHLGIELEFSEATRIANEYSVESNRARIQSLQDTLTTSGVDLNEACNQQICDSATLLHWNHLRPATTKTWRELATKTQRTMLERCFGRWLTDHSYPRDEQVLQGGAFGPPIRLLDHWNMLAGWCSCRLYTLRLNHPGLVSGVKRLVSRPSREKAPSGAVAWQGPTQAKSGSKAEVSS